MPEVGEEAEFLRAVAGISHHTQSLTFRLEISSVSLSVGLE